MNSGFLDGKVLLYVSVWMHVRMYALMCFFDLHVLSVCFVCALGFHLCFASISVSCQNTTIEHTTVYYNMAWHITNLGQHRTQYSRLRQYPGLAQQLAKNQHQRPSNDREDPNR